jgi:hypothetical protein
MKARGRHTAQSRPTCGNTKYNVEICSRWGKTKSYGETTFENTKSKNNVHRNMYAMGSTKYDVRRIRGWKTKNNK